MRNNEKLAKSQQQQKEGGEAGTTNGDSIKGEFDTTDQGFVRPKFLILVPFRSMAKYYLESLLFPLAPPDTQLENHSNFLSSFSIPSDVEDPLTTSSAKQTYPSDHIATFTGNSSDEFRFGIKFTRKAWRVILPPAGEEKLVGCDVIVASPLGIRMMADKEGGTDLLSSLEIVVADGLDVMSMQNWEHVQVSFERSWVR